MQKVLGRIPVGDSEFFFVPFPWHAKYSFLTKKTTRDDDDDDDDDDDNNNNNTLLNSIKFSLRAFQIKTSYL